MTTTKTNTKDLQASIIKNLKTAIDRLNDGIAYRKDYVRFNNNSMACYILATSGGYSVIYDDTNDRLIVAWLVRLFGHEFGDDGITLFNKGDWGQGYYFMNNGGNDLISRYELDKVAELFIEKAFGL